MMEIYADETNERVFVGDGRGPYTVVERDGSTSESFIPRGAVPVAVGDVAERSHDDGYDSGFQAGRDEGYDDGHDDGYSEGLADGRRQAMELHRCLTFLAAKRYRPLSLKSVRGRP
jgi:hypothetical protein